VVIPTTETRDAFLDLVFADEDLLRAEFEAIIEQGWDPPVPERPTPPLRPAKARPARRRARQRLHQARPAAHPVAEWDARQRSPPRRAGAP
jgi:hypothetical protein